MDLSSHLMTLTGRTVQWGKKGGGKLLSWQGVLDIREVMNVSLFDRPQLSSQVIWSFVR